jgi:hypothetical protein
LGKIYVDSSNNLLPSSSGADLTIDQQITNTQTTVRRISQLDTAISQLIHPPGLIERRGIFV